MKVTNVRHLYQLAFIPNLFPVNCYLVEEEDHLTLIDAAMPYSAKAILKTARQIGKPIEKIIITHAHSDHVGALDALTEALPNAEVLMSEREAKLLSGDTSLEKGERNPIKGGVPKNVRTQVSSFLKEGDRVGSLQVVHAPGHTPGMIALFDTRDQSLIVGDAIQTRGGIAVSGDLRLAFPFPAWATWDKQAAIQTAEKLMDLKPSMLAVGHGSLLHDPVEPVNKAIRRAKR
ncbi:MBL fold metallo-hydrolase [Halobacillus locisalis]|uniref:MBL fold metallo-hydrolase n=1 Tax=Halobacillus locisalis TaxID=220753 RepID=A0A838CT42_9BACI|nr:MBL fold metallo-hydrolase [Halobacillus locisalis]MBA2174935.1 MBL fold metallo-hydrolase [Halobacillus locisalis]